VIRAFCAKRGPYDRPEGASGAQFFSRRQRRRFEYRSDLTCAHERAARERVLRVRTAILHHGNRGFIGTFVTRENLRVDSVNANLWRAVSLQRA